MIKNILFLFLGLILTTDSFSQNKLESTGNAGIGTVNPSKLLHILGNTETVRLEAATSTSPVYLQIINGGTFGYAGIEGSTAGASFNGSLPYSTFFTSGPSNNALQFGTYGTARMTIGGTGNVLIGTTNPDVGGSVNGIKLAQNGTIAAAISGTDLSNTPLYLDRRGTNNEGVSMMVAMGGFYKAAISVLGTNSVANNGGISFSTITGNEIITEKMRIQANGNVLVGTTNSDVGGSVTGVKIDPKGMLAAATSGSYLYNHPLYLDRRGINNEGVSMMLAMGGFYKASIGVLGTNSTADNGGISFSTITENETITEKMRILANGNVGIGTMMPTNKLTIEGNTSSALLSLNSLASGKAFLRFSTNGEQNAAMGLSGAIIGNTSSDLSFFAENGNGIHFFNNGSHVPKMIIDTDGNVGIGTGSTTLHEKFAVNGNIRSKEIKVEVTGWPDFVFKSEYKIQSLADLERYIKVNGHLPGIPSSIVAEKEGIELGEMNKKLLHKVEELTLHLIEKDKQIAIESARITKLENALNIVLEKIKALQ